jgi:hypothetical protein
MGCLIYSRYYFDRLQAIPAAEFIGMASRQNIPDMFIYLIVV